MPSIKFTRFWIPCLVLACATAAAVVAWAQNRKAGLWETTTQMTWQKSPMPNGAPPPGATGSRTSQVCLTQAMIEKYGAPMPLNRPECSVTNVQKTDHGMTAEMLCTGHMNGKATMESSWPDPDHASGKVHFNGSIEAGQTPRPIEWTANSTSVFKSADCGTVKPIEPNTK